MAQVITLAGERLFALKAQNNQQLDIDTFIFAYVPGQDATAPIDRNEDLPPVNQRVHTQIVQQYGMLNDNAVVYSSVLDSLTGPFQFNWVGLYSAVNQTLVAIQHIPTVVKTVTEPGASGNILNRNFVIEYSGIAELTGITVDPATWQLDYTARLNGMDELTRQLAADMNGKDWFIDDGFKVVPRSTLNTFKVTAGAGYVSGLRVELAADHIITLSSYPQFVYVDAWFDGTSESIWKGHVGFTVTNTEMDDYIDVNGRNHYVFKLARITAADAVEDYRNIEEFFKDSGTAGISTAGKKRLIVDKKGNIGIGTLNPSAKLHIEVDNDISAGGRYLAKWTGGTGANYQNNDVIFTDARNDVLSDSENWSWGISASNAFNKIPAGVTDDGFRIGSYGWAVSVNAYGYTHAGTLALQIGSRGRAGFQGGGANESPEGAIVKKAVGVRGEIVSDSPLAKIETAIGGEFLAKGYAGSSVGTNIAVLADARNGDVNWSFYGVAGKMFQADQALFGTDITDVDQPAASVRKVGNGLEFGYPSAGGIGGVLGSTYQSGFPAITFCCEVAYTGDTYTTRGAYGHVIYSDKEGNLIFAAVPSVNIAAQEPIEMARLNAVGGVEFQNRFTMASQPPSSSTDVGKVGQFTFDSQYLYTCIAPNQWARVPLITSW